MKFTEHKKIRANRTKMVVPVRLYAHDDSGTPVQMLAHTLDASTSGVKLGGFHGVVKLGQIVTVQYQHRRCNFRVIWIGSRGTKLSTQLGLECLDPNKNIWNLDEGCETTVSTGRPLAELMTLRWVTRSV